MQLSQPEASVALTAGVDTVASAEALAVGLVGAAMVGAAVVELVTEVPETGVVGAAVVLWPPCWVAWPVPADAAAWPPPPWGRVSTAATPATTASSPTPASATIRRRL